MVLLSFLVPLVAVSSTNYPSWWTSVINTNAVPNDYAPATAGQLKWMATKAYEELQANLPGGAGTGVAGQVSAFSTSNNCVPVNLGQLKYVAEPFYARLMEQGYTDAYPWTLATTDDADFAMANIGQVKSVFNFDLTRDADEDDLLDWWEIHWFGGITNQIGSGDADTDGLLNIEEYQRQTDPVDEDTDADGLNDGDEVHVYGADPLDPDTDNDGANDGAEVAARTDPTSEDIAAPSVTLLSPAELETRMWIP